MVFFLFCTKTMVVTKFDIAVKWAKVNQRSSFEQTIMGWSPQLYKPSFVEIGPLLPEKIFEGFFTIYGSYDPDSANKHSFPPTHRGSTQNLALIGRAVTEKNMFEHCVQRRTDGRTPDHGYTISSSMSLRL